MDSELASVPDAVTADNPPLPVTKIKRAYEQVSDQLRGLIVEGAIPPGSRLPVEAAMSAEFGVSRGTIREALRILDSQGLVYSVRGAGGGTFVAQADGEVISNYLATSIGLLSGGEGLTADELLEARELLELPAARLAAERRTDAHLAQMKAAIEADEQTLDRGVNHEFHSAVLDASANRLLHIMTVPVFRVVQARFQSERQSAAKFAEIDGDHREIMRLIAAGDGDGAAAAMYSHLELLRPIYTAIEV